MNQSKHKVNICNWSEAWDNVLERVTIGFGYTSYMYWTMKREGFLLAFDTQVKIALLTITVITGFTKPRKLGAALNCFIS